MTSRKINMAPEEKIAAPVDEIRISIERKKDDDEKFAELLANIDELMKEYRG